MLTRVPYLWQTEAPKKVLRSSFCSKNISTNKKDLILQSNNKIYSLYIIIVPSKCKLWRNKEKQRWLWNKLWRLNKIRTTDTQSSLAYTNSHFNCFSWITWQLVIPSRFISWKTHFLILIGSRFYQIWLGRVTEKRRRTMLRHHNARVNSHQRWKQTRFRVCFHLWCELTSTMSAVS